MCDNENDKYAMTLSEMPQNMLYSLDNQEVVEFETHEPTIHENLLQITVRDRTVIYDIGEDVDEVPRKVKEVTFSNAGSQFIRPDSFVESGFEIARAYEDPSKAKDGYLVGRINQNRCK